MVNERRARVERTSEHQQPERQQEELGIWTQVVVGYKYRQGRTRAGWMLILYVLDGLLDVVDGTRRVRLFGV